MQSSTAVHLPGSCSHAVPGISILFFVSVANSASNSIECVLSKIAVNDRRGFADWHGANLSVCRSVDLAGSQKNEKWRTSTVFPIESEIEMMSSLVIVRPQKYGKLRWSHGQGGRLVPAQSMVSRENCYSSGTQNDELLIPRSYRIR